LLVMSFRNKVSAIRVKEYPPNETFMSL